MSANDRKLEPDLSAVCTENDIRID